MLRGKHLVLRVEGKHLEMGFQVKGRGHSRMEKNNNETRTGAAVD